MESRSPAKKANKRGRKKSKRGSGKLTVDDLTNLSWVAKTAVPMDSSSSSDVQKKGAANGHGDTSLKKIVLKKKHFKSPRPSYKIILKDQKEHVDNDNSGGSSECSSSEKEDNTVYENATNENVINENPSECNDQVDYDLLVDTMISSEDLDPKDPCVAVTTSEKGVPVEESVEEIKSFNKPNCSYTCLIGMALKASTGCLPVNAIYQYIEKEFPYFMTAPDGWKNSVRHNLSLNPIFRKVNPDGWFGKKGHLWEVCPNKQSIVDREIDRFLTCTGKTLKKYSAPVKSNFTRTRQYNKKQLKGGNRSKNPVLCSRCTKIVSPTKNDLSPLHPSSSPSPTSLDGSPKEGMDEYRNYCYDLKEELRSCNFQLKPRLMDTEGILDSSECPLRQAGMNSPPSDPKRIANDLFGVSSPPEHMIPPLTYPGHFLPFCPPTAHYGPPVEGLGGPPISCANSSSSSSTSSPYGPIATYMPALPLQYMMWGHYPQFYNAMFAKEMSSDADEYANLPLTPPTPTEVYKVTDDIRMGINGVNSPKKRLSEESPDVASLNSPMKKMKVKKNGVGVAAENIGTSYLGDISNNETVSDCSQMSEEEVQYGQMYWPMLPDLLNSLNYYNHDMCEALSNYSTPTKADLEQMVGDSDLKTLLENSYRYLPNSEETAAATDDDNQSYTEDSPEVVECAASQDCQEIESEMPSGQKEPSFFPSLDSLLQIGDHTIMSLSSAMLDIQNTVEVVTAEDNTTNATDPTGEESG